SPAMFASVVRDVCREVARGRAEIASRLLASQAGHSRWRTDLGALRAALLDVASSDRITFSDVADVHALRTHVAAYARALEAWPAVHEASEQEACVEPQDIGTRVRDRRAPEGVLVVREIDHVARRT